MLQYGNRRPSAANGDETPVPNGEVPHMPQARRAYVEQGRPTRWWEKLLRQRTRYAKTPITVWLYHYSGDGDYDGPVLVIRSEAIEQSGITTGSMIVLDDDEGTTTKARVAPPAAEVRWISIERRKNRMVLCHWWRRGREHDGTRKRKHRMDRQDELLGMIHAR